MDEQVPIPPQPVSTIPPVPPPAVPQAQINKPKNPFAFIFLGVLILIIVSTGGYYLAMKITTPPHAPGTRVCTMEAKLCPDGTSVGRTGPNCEFSPCPTTTVPIQTTMNPTGAVKDGKFTGTITDVNTECFSDGSCSIKVDNKWITTGLGGLEAPNTTPKPHGRLIGINFYQNVRGYIGKKAEVYAKQVDSSSYTLFGSNDYYIKLVN